MCWTDLLPNIIRYNQIGKSKLITVLPATVYATALHSSVFGKSFTHEPSCRNSTIIPLRADRGEHHSARACPRKSESSSERGSRTFWDCIPNIGQSFETLNRAGERSPGLSHTNSERESADRPFVYPSSRAHMPGPDHTFLSRASGSSGRPKTGAARTPAPRALYPQCRPK